MKGEDNKISVILKWNIPSKKKDNSLHDNQNKIKAFEKENKYVKIIFCLEI